jgi:predicted RNA binding protein YcfA (HicA-like mRNA interferase family)
MPKLPVIKGRELIKFLETLDFKVTGTKGSHSRLKSEDGRATSVLYMGIKMSQKVYYAK